MKTAILLLLLAVAARAQTNAIQLCDRQSTRHCLSLRAPGSLAFNPQPILLSGKDGGLLVGLESTDMSLLPGAIVSADALVSVSSTTNASVISMAATPFSGAGPGADISVAKTGTGTLLPLRFFRNPNELARFDTSNRFLLGLASTDVTGGIGSMTALGPVVVATAVSNASVGSFGAVAGTYVALASAQTGSGSYLPMTFFTQATERLRIRVDGVMLAGLTSTDVSALPGAIISGDALVSATQAANASVASLKAVASTYVALSSSRTGSGGYLPLILSTSGLERLRVDTNGNIGIGNTLPGTALDVNGGVRTNDGFVATGYGATGWAGAGAEVGSALGNAYFTGFNRTGGVYIDTYIRGANINLQYNGATGLTLTTSGRVLLGLSSSDVSSLAGSLVAGDALVSTTAATNASVGSFKAVAGTYVALASAQTGSGSYLPMTFFTQATERLRIRVDGVILSGLASTDVSALAGAIISSDALVSATAATNASVGSFKAVASTYVALASSRSGTGAFLPMTFFTNNAEAARFETNQRLLLGLTSSDVTGGSGSMTAVGPFVVATAASNASVGSFGAVAGTYVALASSRSGTGAFLPMTFFTNNAEHMRILTTGPVLVGRTADDGTGASLQTNNLSVNGTIQIGGVVRLGSTGTGAFTNLSFNGTMTPPSGTALNGVVTCSGAQHVNTLTISQGIVTAVGCS